MFRAANELQRAFITKEEIEKLLVNLEEFKSEGSVTDEQYDYLRKDYDGRLTAANSALAQQRFELKSRLEDSQTSLANYKLELDRLSLRFKVGELLLEKYERSDRKVRRRASKTQAEIAELERLLDANSSSDMGILPTILGEVSTRGRGFSIPEASSFTAFVSSFAEVTSPRTRLLGSVGGLFLFISVFMPWVSSGGFGFRISYPAADLSGHLVAAGITFGLLAIAAVFLVESDTKSFAHIVVGGIALLVLLIVMVVPRSELDTNIVGAINRGWMTIGAGLVFYIISAIAVICGGVFERREA